MRLVVLHSGCCYFAVLWQLHVYPVYSVLYLVVVLGRKMYCVDVYVYKRCAHGPEGCCVYASLHTKVPVFDSVDRV